jgi:hypothetical protein
MQMCAFGQTLTNNEAISRETSVFNFGPPSANVEAISREFSVFNFGPDMAPVEAISRELSVMNLGLASANLEAISREVSVFNFGQPSATVEAISREVSVFNDTNFVVLTLGGQIVRAGESGAVPLAVACMLDLTNVQVTLVTPPDRLTAFGLEPIQPQICASTATLLTNGVARLNLVMCPNQWLTGTQQVAWLHFTALSNQSSAFVYAALAAPAASGFNGYSVSNFVTAAGRLIIVGEEPLLEFVRDNNGLPLLTIYGESADGYSLEWRTNLVAGSWQTVLTGLTVPANLVLQIPPPASTNRENYYRAVRQAP